MSWEMQESKTARSTAVQPMMAAPSGELSDDAVGRLFLVANPPLSDPSRQPSEGRAAWDVAAILPQVCDLLASDHLICIVVSSCALLRCTFASLILPPLL